MIRWLLLLLAFASAFLGLLTVTKVPEIISWQAAVLAGEFGYMVAALPAVLLFLTFFSSGLRTTLTFWLSLAAVILLVQPCIQAWYIGRTLPARLRAAYGDPSPARPPRAAQPFSWRALFATPPARVEGKTIEFAPNLSLDFYAPSPARPPISEVERVVPTRWPTPDPSKHPAPVPLVLIIHGGGWNTGVRGDIVSLDYELVRAGYAVADMSYRLAPKAQWPAQRDDVNAALLYLKTHAAELGIDPRRIVLLGRSAGGQIAEATAYEVERVVPNALANPRADPARPEVALHHGPPPARRAVALQQAGPAICGVIALYSPADMLFAYQYGREDDILKSPSLLRQYLGGPPSAAKANYENASSYYLAGPHSPPTLLVHGKLDTLVWYRQSERLADKLAGFGVKHLLVSLPWATHAVEYNPQGPSGQLTVYAIEWFLGAITR